MKRVGGKKVAAIVLVMAAFVVGLSGTAVAYVFVNGSNSGAGSVGTGGGSGFTVSSLDLEGGPLTIDPNNMDTISASISNFTGLPLTLHQIEVQITGVTVDANTQNPAWPACTASQFVLLASSSSPWQELTPNGALEIGPAALWTENLPQTVPNGDFVSGANLATGTAPFVSTTSANGVPPGLFLEWLDLGPNVIQNNCLGATVQLTVSVNGLTTASGGSGGGSSTGGASFAVTKSASPSTVRVGSSTPITYTLTAQNNGDVPGSVSISDTVPPGTTLVSGSNTCPAVTAPTGCRTTVNGSTVTFLLANVVGGASIAPAFEVTVNSGVTTGTISNTAYWSGPGCSAPVSCPTNATSTNVTAPTPVLVSASPTTTLYGSGTPTVTPIYTPSIGAQPATPPTCHSTVTAATRVGTYAGANTCSGASDPAYAFTYAPGTASVHPAPLTITASSGSFSFGENPPTITPQYSGFENGETAAALTTQPTCSTTATSSSSPATYPSTCSGAADPNYSFTYAAGTVTVTAPSTLPSTSIPPTTPSHTPPNSVIAFTGALLSQEWLAGVAALLLGAGLVVVARWRRSKPTVATRRSTDAGRGSLPPD